MSNTGFDPNQPRARDGKFIDTGRFANQEADDVLLARTNPPEGMDETQAQFYRDALDHGFEEYPPGGPWGKQDHTRGLDPRTNKPYQTGERIKGDRSVVLVRDDIVIHLIDRDHHAPWQEEPLGHETAAVGWFENGKRAFGGPITFPYDDHTLDVLRNQCGDCGVTGVELHKVGFAGAYCEDCAPRQRELQEFRGWTL